MQYAEAAPGPALAGWAEACWTVRGEVGERVRILADACTDVIALDARGARVLFVGPMTRAEVMELTCEVTHGVRLRPGARLDLDGRPLSALRDRELVVDDPAGDDPAAGPGPRSAHDGLLAFLDHHRGSRRLTSDLTVDAVLRAISAGDTTLSALYARLGVKERTVQRLFDVYVGLTPKQCLRRVRHIGVGRSLRAGADSIAELAAVAGFADQPHLTRDFMDLAGIQPARFAREAAADGFLQDAPVPASGGSGRPFEQKERP